MAKKILLLGASGSIGQQTLDVIRSQQNEFELASFSVGNNIDVAISILNEFDVMVCWIKSKENQSKLQTLFPKVQVMSGEKELITLIDRSNADWVVNALMGFVGFEPTLHAIKSGKNIALANKETLVSGGSIIMDAVKRNRVSLTPIDSEHSAIYQCLIGHSIEEVRNVYLTASGGAFREMSHTELQHVTKEQALAHPNWVMGEKITIDSATMMNKGLEVIEAHFLFGFDYDSIKVLIQPESQIHSMVEFKDTSVIAQLSTSDMRLPIQMALSDKKHLNLNISPLDFSKEVSLTLKPVPKGRYPLFELAIKMGREGGIAPAVMNGANEVAVEAFLENQISYYELENTVLWACENFENKTIETVQDVMEADSLGRDLALQFLKGR